MNSSASSGLSASDMALTALFSALMAVCSWISIPTAVPFTLQTFAVFLTFQVLGGKLTFLSVLVFLALGSVGLPVFSGFAGGPGILLGNTGGYLIGFLFTALFLWISEKWPGNNGPVRIIWMILGLAICYAFGTAWFMLVYSRVNGATGLLTALGWCVFPFIIPDLIKILLAWFIGTRIRKISYAWK